MPQLLLEFFSEEIPARMQKRAEEDLAKAMKEKLAAHGLVAAKIETFSTPRRLGLVIEDLPAKAADVNEEKKGPRVGAPDAAVQGFLKSAGLASLDQAQIVNDKKGDFYVARIERAGREAAAILAEMVPEIVRGFPWPKSMRSGSSDLQWVRPLHNILCLFGGAPVAIAIEGVGAAPHTWGHRFHSSGAIAPKDAVDHYAKLRAAKVLINRDERRAIILERARALCAERKLELVEDAGLLEEVTGLVEWPVVLMGRMDAAFLDLPGEVIRLSMRTHQKYFAVRDPQTQKLAPFFIVVANIDANDGGDAIAAGNARVLSARLNDARFFWDGDKKTPLYTDERKAKLEKIVFHQKLGSVWDKVERVKALAVELCAVTGADAALVARAAELCKMDLVTETVGEFPELQGQIGRQLYLAELSASSPLAGEGREGGNGGALSGKSTSATPTPGPAPQGGGESVAQAIEDHYRPLGPNDRVPSDPVAVTLALADKLDTLVGFWAIDEKPTGSSDPYALRRAALGVVRTLRDNKVRLNLGPVIADLFEDGIVEDAYGIELLHDDVDKLGQLRDCRIAFAVNYDGRFDRFARVFAHSGVGDEDLSQEDLTVIGEMAERINSLAKFSEKSQNLPDDAGLIELGDRTVQLAPDHVTEIWREYQSASDGISSVRRAFVGDLLAFLADRLKVQLRDQGKRHDLVDAVFALGDDDLIRIVARVEALDAFLKTEDGANLLAGYKRAANILAAEEKKGRLAPEDVAGDIDESLLEEPAEKALYAALQTAEAAAVTGVKAEKFANAMTALATLRAPVFAFFDDVLVNAENPLLRRNRLLLLSRIRDALSAVADFSKIEG